jgi:hypothetical protein
MPNSSAKNAATASVVRIGMSILAFPEDNSISELSATLI